MNESKYEIYRSVIAKENTTTEIFKYQSTRRPPGNVPYIVDNLWEWKRPEKFPNRRSSVYGSPAADLAEKSGADNGTVFYIELQGNYKLCQLSNYADAKEHPECKSLKKLILKKMGRPWASFSLKEKEEIGRLWIPCLAKDEIDQIISESPQLTEIRQELWDSIKFWEDAIVINQELSNTNDKGEIFFEAFDGYYLRNI